MKCDARKVGCNESLHPAICVKLPMAGLRRQMRKGLPTRKRLAICVDDDSSTDWAVASSSGSRRRRKPPRRAHVPDQRKGYHRLL